MIGVVAGTRVGADDHLPEEYVCLTYDFVGVAVKARLVQSISTVI